MTIEKIKYDLWQYLYNKYSINGVLIISRENFEYYLELLTKRFEE